MKINRLLLQRVKDWSFPSEQDICNLRNICDACDTKSYKFKELAPLNKVLKGFRPGELTIFSGGTGIGKTTFLSHYSLDLCRNNDVRTVWLSLEVRYHIMLQKMLVQYANKPLSAIPVDENDFERKLSKLPLILPKERGRATFADLKSFVELIFSNDDERILKTGFPAKCLKPEHLIIDNLQFIDTENGLDQYGLQQNLVVKYLREKSSEENCHITLVAHPRKLNPLSNLITIGDLFGGCKLAQEADNIIILQSIKQSLHSVKYLDILKNRYDGTLGRLYLNFNKETLRYKVERSEIY